MLLRDSLLADARTQALAPDLRRKVDANRAARVAQERVLAQQTEAQASAICPIRVVRPKSNVRHVQTRDPEAAKPIWADPQR